MRTANLPNGAIRTSDVGFIWEEKLTNASGSIEVPQYATFRVKAAAAGTVTVDGILAMTMATNEIVVFNAGDGVPTANKATVTVTFSAAVYCQVARSVERPRPTI